MRIGLSDLSACTMSPLQFRVREKSGHGCRSISFSATASVLLGCSSMATFTSTSLDGCSASPKWTLHRHRPLRLRPPPFAHSLLFLFHQWLRYLSAWGAPLPPVLFVQRVFTQVDLRPHMFVVSLYSTITVPTSSQQSRPPKADVDSQWGHDMYESENNLSARLGVQPVAPRVNFGPARKFVEKAAGISSSELSIKGASQNNVIEVTGLVKGTTAEDVAAIFKRCGAITDSKVMAASPEVVIRLTFKDPSSAKAAVAKFDKQQADGKTLSVVIIGLHKGPSLFGRLASSDGMGLVMKEGSVDVLMDSENDNGSYVVFTFFSSLSYFAIRKMRSDAILKDPRAQVLLAPPGADPKDYTQTPWRGGRGGGRGGRGRRGGGGRRLGNGGNRKMDLD